MATTTMAGWTDLGSTHQDTERQIPISLWNAIAPFLSRRVRVDGIAQRGTADPRIEEAQDELQLVSCCHRDIQRGKIDQIGVARRYDRVEGPDHCRGPEEVVFL